MEWRRADVVGARRIDSHRTVVLGRAMMREFPLR
jgi:hypothetical protein